MVSKFQQLRTNYAKYKLLLCICHNNSMVGRIKSFSSQDVGVQIFINFDK